MSFGTVLTEKLETNTVFQTPKNHLRFFFDFSDKKPFFRFLLCVKILNLKMSWNNFDRKIWRPSQFSKTPCAETILILETPWHNSDRNIGGKAPIFQYTMPLKDSHLRSFLQQSCDKNLGEDHLSSKHHCSERILIIEVSWNSCNRKIGRPPPFFQTSCT